MVFISPINPTRSVMPYPFVLTPINNISPLTYRDGTTYLEMFEQMRQWLNDSLVPSFNTNLTDTFASFVNELQHSYDSIATTETAWQSGFDAFMADVVAQLRALNDQAMADLIALTGTATRDALDTMLTGSPILVNQFTAINAAVAALNTTTAAIDTVLSTRLADATIKENGRMAAINFIATDLPTKAALDTAAAARIADLSSATRAALNLAIVDQKGQVFTAWKAAVQGQDTAVAKLVIAGDSIAQGGRVSSSIWQWGNRLSALYTDNPVILVTDAAPAVSLPPSNGVQVWNMAEGGRTSANYLTTDKVAAVGVIKPHIMIHGVAANDITQEITPAAFYNNLVNWHDQVAAVSPNTVHIYVLFNEPNAYAGSLKYADYEAQYKKLQDNGYGYFLNIWSILQKNVGTKYTDRYGLLFDDIHYDNNGNKIYSAIFGDLLGAPRWDYIPREYVQPPQFDVTGPIPDGVSTTLATIKVKRKPYTRYMSFNVGVNVMPGVSGDCGIAVYGVNSNLTTEVAFNSIYHNKVLTAGTYSTLQFSDATYLPPNKDYDIILRAVPKAGVIMNISTDVQRLRFNADLSPA